MSKCVRTPVQSALEECIHEHLSYELEMMRTAYKKLSSSIPTPQFQHNLNGEGCANHSRNLILFFGSPKKDGDINACHFVPGYKKIETFDITKINKQIAHITDQRTIIASDKFGPVDWKKVSKAIESEFANWLGQLPSHWKTRWDNRKCKDGCFDDPAVNLTLNVAFPMSPSSAVSSTSFNIGPSGSR